MRDERGCSTIGAVGVSKNEVVGDESDKRHDCYPDRIVMSSVVEVQREESPADHDDGEILPDAKRTTLVNLLLICKLIAESVS